MLVCIYLCLVWLIVFCVFCAFVVGYGSATPNDDIVRFRCGGESYTFFAHIFVKNFNFLYSLLGFGVVCAFFIGFLSLFAWLLVCI